MLWHYRCRIRYSPENIQGVVVWMALRTNSAAFNRWNDERNVNVNRDDNRWNDNWWFAGRRNYSHFERPPLGGRSFCDATLPYQPPNCLPASSSGSERAAYRFVSSEPVSHSTMSSTFTVSSFRIATRIHGAFAERSKKVADAAASIHSTSSPSIRTPNVYRCVFGSFW